MYKTLFVMNNDLGRLEDRLNDLAEQDYRLVFSFQDNNRLIFIMEYRPGPGRPKRKTEEAKLGD